MINPDNLEVDIIQLGYCRPEGLNKHSNWIHRNYTAFDQFLGLDQVPQSCKCYSDISTKVHCPKICLCACFSKSSTTVEALHLNSLLGSSYDTYALLADCERKLYLKSL